MSIQPIGLLTIALGCVCLFLDYRATVIAFVVTSIFGAAAAMFIGAANIQPGHVFLGFALLVVLSRRREAAALLRAFHPDRPGFWLAALVFYGIATAFMFPRLMAGITDIVPLGSSAYDETGFTVPLGPVSSNLTQSVYMLANLLCFAVFVAFASSRDGFRAVVAGVIAYAIANVFLAFLDVATYYTGTQSLLEFMRNARYQMHTEGVVAGMKRIVGSFTETSSFARSTAGVVGFTGTLWICGYRPMLTGSLALVSLFLMLLSTSSTGLVSAPVVVTLLYLTAMTRAVLASGTRNGARNGALMVLALPLLAAFVLLLVTLHPTLSVVIRDYADEIVLSKATTESGVERSSWNTVAIQNFIDSYGFGVGLGTIRTSSIAMALVAGTGVIGTFLYVVFLASALLVNPGRRGEFHTDARTAARNACICLIVGDVLISSTIDQGIFFYALAAIASARPEYAVVRTEKFVPMGVTA